MKTHFNRSFHFLSLVLAAHCGWAANHSAEPKVAGKVITVSGEVLVRSDDGSTGSGRALLAGTYFHTNDVINTSSTGNAKLLLSDRTIMDIGPSTLFHVKNFQMRRGDDRQVDVTAMYGTVRTAVTKGITGAGHFKVRTVSATMGVRGTEFIVKSSVETLQEIQHAVKNPGTALAPTITTPLSQTPEGKTVAPPAAKMEVVVLQGKVDVTSDLSSRDTGRFNSRPAPISLAAGQTLAAGPNMIKGTNPVSLNSDQMKTVASANRVEDNTFKKTVTIDPKSSQNQGTNNTGNSSNAASTKESTASATKNEPKTSSSQSTSQTSTQATESSTSQNGTSSSTQKGSQGSESESGNASTSGSTANTASSSSSGTATAAASTSESTTSTGAGTTTNSNRSPAMDLSPAATAPPPSSGNSTQDMIHDVITLSVAPATVASTPAAVDVISFIPAPKAPEPVVIPAGGLKHVTIRISR